MSSTDYLVIGCGAMAMAFVDVMLQETDATFTIVDRRLAPGGHWNDAYPFVRLHQPSAYYGVASRPLGRGRIDERGFNAGFYELASGVEVTQYFHELMRDTFLASGRVDYYPLHDYVGNYAGDGEFVSLLSGERHRIAINKKLVNATMLQTSIPLTHKPNFTVATGITCIPPNHLPRLAADFKRFTVLGGGKTGIDSAVWLLENGVKPDNISWVVPRDPWMINRAGTQPGLEFFNRSLGGVAKQFEICATARSVTELCERMEQAGMWMRLSSDVWPTLLHGATVTETDLEHLRRIQNVIRLGHVQHIEASKIILDEGEAPSTIDTLYIDCTARALAANVGNLTPVFDGDTISLQMVRQFQPCFSASLIGHIEATISDDQEKKRLTQVVPMADTIDDWISTQITSMTNQLTWANHDINRWIQTCRVNAFGSTVAQVREDDNEKREILGRLSKYAQPAVENLRRLANNIGELNA